MELKKLIRDKKGLGIGDLYPIIITITIIAILLAIVMMVLVEWIGVTNNLVYTVNNETLTTVEEHGEHVSNYTACGFDDFSVIGITNESTPETILPGNYTIDAKAGIIYGGLEAYYNNTNWNITYSYSYGGKDCEAVEDIISDYTDFIPWIGIILLVIAAAIVLGLVISSFASKEGRV